MEQPAGSICEARWLGMVDYDTAWRLQDRFADEIARGARPPTLLLLEHPHTFTLGKRGRDENVLWTKEQRDERGVTLRYIDRGGDVTYHGPGQLVGYPLLSLAPKGWNSRTGQARIPQADYVGYVRNLEKMLIYALARLGIAAGQREGLTGVWVASDVMSRCPRCDPAHRAQPGKIASIGVKVDANGISRHGFALNVATDRLYWEGIVPCGLEQVQMINLADFLDPPPSVEQVGALVQDAFEEVFPYKLRRIKGL